MIGSDFLAFRRYVEFVSPNLTTSSLKFMHRLFAACSDVEVVLKQLRARLGEKGSEPEDILMLVSILNSWEAEAWM